MINSFSGVESSEGVDQLNGTHDKQVLSAYKGSSPVRKDVSNVVTNIEVDQVNSTDIEGEKNLNIEEW